MLLNACPDQSLCLADVLFRTNCAGEGVHSKLPVATYFNPARQDIQSLRGQRGILLDCCCSSTKNSWMVQPDGRRPNLTSLCFRFGACLYTTLIGRLDFLTILRACLSRLFEQKGRHNFKLSDLLLSELLFASFMQEADRRLALSRANSISWLGSRCFKAKPRFYLRCAVVP